MGNDHIRRAMNAGKRWAEEQLKLGNEITPDSVEQAAAQQFRYRGSQYLFLTSALEVVYEAENRPAIQAES